MIKTKTLLTRLFLTACFTITLVSCSNNEVSEKPNIVIFYVDDLGYGDVSCYGATAVQTPNVDNLANNGIKFTDAHCSASTCTPSRYSLLTGSYAFRNNAAILPGDAPLIIDTAMRTLPDMLQDAGYTTGVVGKWHLGLGNGYVDWNKRITPGPNEIGFDYSYLIPATGDRVPTVFVENGKVEGLEDNDPITVSYTESFEGEPTGLLNPELLKQKADTQHSCAVVNGISRIGYMTGGKNALWVDEEFPNVLVDKASKFIEESQDNPFFLYFSFHDIHVPRVPNAAFVGATDMGPRGDAIAQMDWCVGKVMDVIKNLGLEENTLVIFTSDNGPVLDDGYDDEAVERIGNHDPSGGFKGGKYSAYEAGTRVPSIVYWRGKVIPMESTALTTQVDLYASIAKLVGEQLGANDAPDSFEQLDTWLGKAESGREYMLEEAFTFALRRNNWKFIAPQTKPTPGWLANKDIASGLSPELQLYDLSNDPKEQNNLVEAHPEVVQQMQKKLQNIMTTPSRITAE